MNHNSTYGNIGVYCPNGTLLFRANAKKLRFYKKNGLIEQIDESSYKLNFQPAGLGHADRNQELLVPRENKCVCCGEEGIEHLTRHHIVPTRYRKHFPMSLKSNNHRYVVFLCYDCHHTYNKHEAIRDQEISVTLGLEGMKAEHDSYNVNKRLISGIADTLLFKDRLPSHRIDELKEKFSQRTGLEPTEENLVRMRKLRYAEPEEETRYYKLAVDRVGNLYQFQQDWLEHFVDTMNPGFLPNDLIILLNAL